MAGLEVSFLQEIARQPHDWLPRLIFADWLEEQGDLRGELIRLSHQLTRLDCEDRAQKEARLQALSAVGVVWPSPSLPNSLDMKFVLIPPGQFRMGSPESEPERKEDENQVDVTLSQGFWLGQYEVTQAEYQAVIGHNPSHFNQEQLQKDSSKHPVEQVHWKGTLDFCLKLTSQEHAAGCLSLDWEYRLPTEAQWEYACRAGTSSPTAFGDKLDSRQANFLGSSPYNGADKGDSKGETSAVGTYKANAWNLYDMHGNIYEWCWDWYFHRDWASAQSTNRNLFKRAIAPRQATQRVARGGCWSIYGGCCRSASRFQFTPRTCSPLLGFRVAVVQVR